MDGDMTLNSAASGDSLSNWLSLNLSYQGNGRAEFLDPIGIAEGPTSVTFDEFGQSTVEMQIEEIHCERKLLFGLMEFFTGEKPVQKGQSFTMGWGGSFNPCSNLTVETVDGTFSAAEKVLYELKGMNLLGLGGRIVFHSIRSKFQRAHVRAPKYWVLPLFNLLSEFRPYLGPLDRHPLRISRQGLDREDGPIRNTGELIVFEFNDGLGFIEPLADFTERKARLLNGRERTLITAVMVGEAIAKPTDFPELRDWFPSGFLSLLGLSTGTEVGAPWVEFRDSQGQLSHRVHVKMGQPIFSRGFDSIRETIHGGTGRLLTNAFRSPDYESANLQSALNYLVLGGLDVFTLEDKINFLCRSVDSLCTEYGLTKQVLLHRLDADNQKIVAAALDTAAKGIRDAASKITDATQHETLLKIANRTKSNPANIDVDFGLAVIDLLKRFDLSDATVVAAHYQSKPRPDGRTWAQALSHYRGIAAHKGYFEFGTDEEIQDVFRFVRHLHDILVRIVFKRLGYDLTYQPTVSRFTTDMTVDWVRTDTTASALGY